MKLNCIRRSFHLFDIKSELNQDTANALSLERLLRTIKYSNN